MNKVILITTEGCEGCAIMHKNIKIAIAKVHFDITLECKDFKDIDKKFRNKYKIKDFPTTLIFKDDDLKVKWVGTMPFTVIVRWFDIHFV